MGNPVKRGSGSFSSIAHQAKFARMMTSGPSSEKDEEPPAKAPSPNQDEPEETADIKIEVFSKADFAKGGWSSAAVGRLMEKNTTDVKEFVPKMPVDAGENFKDVRASNGVSAHVLRVRRPPSVEMSSFIAALVTNCSETIPKFVKAFNHENRVVLEELREIYQSASMDFPDVLELRASELREPGDKKKMLRREVRVSATPMVTSLQKMRDLDVLARDVWGVGLSVLTAHVRLLHRFGHKGAAFCRQKVGIDPKPPKAVAARARKALPATSSEDGAPVSSEDGAPVDSRALDSAPGTGGSDAGLVPTTNQPGGDDKGGLDRAGANSSPVGAKPASDDARARLRKTEADAKPCEAGAGVPDDVGADSMPTGGTPNPSATVPEDVVQVCSDDEGARAPETAGAATQVSPLPASPVNKRKSVPLPKYGKARDMQVYGFSYAAPTFEPQDSTMSYLCGDYVWSPGHKVWFEVAQRGTYAPPPSPRAAHQVHTFGPFIWVPHRGMWAKLKD